MEGAPFRKASSGLVPPVQGGEAKVPLSAFGQPGAWKVASTLYTYV